MNSRVLLVDPDDGKVVLTLSADSGADLWPDYRYPNGSQVWTEDGRVLLLVTFKGGAAENQGRIVLWDLTDLGAPRRLWQYPENGYLAAVHNAMVKDGLLSYGHSFGASDAELGGDEGTVGLAHYSGPEKEPIYLADLRGNFGFVREAEVETDTLLVTDSACENPKSECTRLAGVYTIKRPMLTPTGRTGGFSADHSQQLFLDAEIVKVEVEGDNGYPYESDRIDFSKL
jgi:hypothetical protein